MFVFVHPRTGALATDDPDLDQPDLDAQAEAAKTARAGRRLERLEELAAIGMRFARALEREARAFERAETGAGDGVETPAEPQGPLTPEAAAKRIGDLGLAFSRVARAVRQTLALEARLDAPPRPDKAVETAREIEARLREEAAAESVGAAERIRERLRRIAEACDAEEVERAEILADPDDNDDDDEVLGRSPEAVIAGVRRDLGLAVAFEAGAGSFEARRRLAPQDEEGGGGDGSPRSPFPVARGDARPAPRGAAP